MISLNAGNLWTTKYLDKVIELNHRHFQDDIQVTSLYGSVSQLTPTARSFDRIPFMSDDNLKRFVDRAQFNGINIRYTLNASCFGPIQSFKSEWENNLNNVILYLHEVGIHEWVVTSPLLIELLASMFPRDLIEVSTIDELSTAKEVMMWKQLGANAVNASIMANRDFYALTKMNDVLPVTLLANEFCIYRCPWRRSCYDLSSHDSSRGEKFFSNYPYNRCNNLRLKSPTEWVRSRFILPEWLQFYSDECNITRFKLTGRTHPIEVMLPILESYMNRKSPDNMLSLWPTVAGLGNTAEPAESTYISCDALNKFSFIEHFKDISCSDFVCGETCAYCDWVYRHCSTPDSKG